MLQAVDERLSIWGWETGTGTRFAVVIDAWGKSGNKGARGLSDGDLRGVSRQLVSSWREWGVRNTDTWVALGFQGAANGVYTAVAESVLCAG